jgi:site-specific recombinase XerD
MNNILLKNLFIEYLTGCGLKKSTISRMRIALKIFYKYLNGKDIRDVKESGIICYIKHLRSVQSLLGKPYSSNTIEIYLMAVKSFYVFLYKNDYILTNPMEEIKIRQGYEKKIIVMFGKDEISAFLDCITLDDPESQRDRAFFELLYSSGLRVREGINLELENVNFEERIVLIKLGKGGKDRYVPFSELAMKFILKYVNDGRVKQIGIIKDNDSKKWLFLTESGKASYYTITKRFKRYLKKCGLTGKGLRIHSIRHSTATHLLENGASIRYVQELLGHENIDTTQIYARPDIGNIKRIYKTYHPRENEYYEDANAEYLKHVYDFKDRLLRQKKICERERKNKIKYRLKKKVEFKLNVL